MAARMYLGVQMKCACSAVYVQMFECRSVCAQVYVCVQVCVQVC